VRTIASLVSAIISSAVCVHSAGSGGVRVGIFPLARWGGFESGRASCERWKDKERTEAMS